MRVLMFGWEFPPVVSGGLGVATEGLVRGLLESGTEVALVLPRHPGGEAIPDLEIIEALGRGAPLARRPGALRLSRIPSLLRPYVGAREYAEAVGRASRADAEAGGRASRGDAEAGGRAPQETEETGPGRPPPLYGADLAAEVVRYAAAAGAIARRERCDVIHAHDWLTFLAGLEARRASGRPLAVHVHATEFDRAGEGGDPFVRGIERLGVTSADRVIAVSAYTAETIHSRYGVPAERLRVVHNAIDPEPAGEAGDEDPDIPPKRGPLVLFAGRVTWQKGPEQFVEAAALVARELPLARFAVAGSGDRLEPTIARARALGVADRFVFTGFLPREDLDRLYRQADVYVMPSVSEPFGITALEALRHGTPVIVSRHAGVSEVVEGVLRVDFGNTRDLASKILSILLFRPLSDTLSRRGQAEAGRLSWKQSAARCLAVYREMLAAGT